MLWGDHGWHLGEKEHWRKFAIWEETTRAPLMWVAPGVTPKGVICEATVDIMSVYPTLCELTGLYDEQADPYEWTNLAGDKTQASTIKQLQAWLPKSNAKPAMAKTR